MHPRFREFSERLGLGLLGLALPLAFYPAAEDAYRLPQLSLLTLATLLLCMSWKWAPPLTLPSVLGASFFAWRFLTHALAGPDAAWMLEQGLYALLFFWGLAHLHEKRLASRFKAALLTGVSLAALYAFIQSYGWDPLASGAAEAGFGARAHSTLGNPDFWGGYLILALPFALEFPPLAAWLALALALCQTRAAWLGFAAGLAVPLAKGGTPRRQAGLMLVAFALALMVTSFANPLNPGGLNSLKRLVPLGSAAREGASGRLSMDRIALSIVLKHPLFGSGAGHFKTAFLEEQGQRLNDSLHWDENYLFTHDAHNDWLQLAAESGILALLLFAVLLKLAFFKAWRGKERAWPLAALLLSFSLNALLHFPLAIIPSAAVVWLALGWSLSESGKAPAPPAWPLAAMLPLVASFFFMRQLQASALLNRGMNLSLGGRPEAADPLLKTALRINAADTRAWMRLGLNAEGRGDLKASEEAFEHCQDSPEGLANLSLERAKLGKLDEARLDSLAALKLNPKSLQALGNLGHIEFLRGDLAAAEGAYLNGIAFDPNWVQGHFNLAAIYLNSGRKNLALPHLRRVLELEPQNAQARQLLK